MSVIMTPEEQRARKRRNFWIAIAVGGFMALVFAITLTQMNAYSIAGASQ